MVSINSHDPTAFTRHQDTIEDARELKGQHPLLNEGEDSLPDIALTDASETCILMST